MFVEKPISSYPTAAGVGVWPPGGWGRQAVSKPAIGVTTDFGPGLSAPRAKNHGLVPCDSAKPAIEVTTATPHFGWQAQTSASTESAHAFVPGDTENRGLRASLHKRRSHPRYAEILLG